MTCGSLLFQTQTWIQIAWVYQILLSEVFGVPVTIEMGDGTSRQDGSFYDSESRFVYPDHVYPVEDLIEADRFDGDCTLTDKPCAHILPEVWDGASNADITTAQGKIFLPNHINFLKWFLTTNSLPYL